MFDFVRLPNLIELNLRIEFDKVRLSSNSERLNLYKDALANALDPERQWSWCLARNCGATGSNSLACISQDFNNNNTLFRMKLKRRTQRLSLLQGLLPN